MNRIKLFLSLVGISVLVLSALFLAGCGKKLVTSAYVDEKNKVSVALSYPDDSKYSYSTEEEDLHTSAEEAILTADSYKIAWDIVSVGYSGDFESVKQKAMEKDEAKEVEYNGIKGVSYYYSPYVRYTVALPINDKCYIEFHIYSTDEQHDKNHVDEVFAKDEVQNILKTVDIKQS